MSEALPNEEGDVVVATFENDRDKYLRAIADLDNMQDDLVDIKARTDRMRRTVAYRSDTDVIPLQESIAQADAQKRGRPVPNVLAEEYWDVYKALVR